MDFIDRNKKKIKTISLVLLTITIFSLSYYICINRLKSVNIENSKYGVRSKIDKLDDANVANSNVNVVVSSDSNIVFKVKYAKSGEIITEKEEVVGNLAGKKKNELEGIYKSQGYRLQSITSSQVVFIRELDKYAPNKYVLGIKNACIAIYKTDKEGNMFIENEKRDITDIKIDRLKEADIQLLTKGNKYFQCNTREDAEARLEDYE